jgi:uncharacterized glyoxalase superfamily protein PhnB
MGTPAKNYRPEYVNTLSAYLVIDGAAQAIEFYKKALNAVEIMRMPGPNGKIMHASLRIGDSALMLTDEWPDYGARGPKALGGTPVTIHLYVEDADAVMRQAEAAGATIKLPVHDAFWGDRYGQFIDPYGHHWSVATHKMDLSPEEIGEAMKNMPNDCGGNKA